MTEPTYDERLDDDEPRFELVDEDVHYDGPDEPSVGREFYEEPYAGPHPEDD